MELWKRFWQTILSILESEAGNAPGEGEEEVVIAEEEENAEEVVGDVEDSEEAKDEVSEDEEEAEDAGDDSGKDVGKDRSKYIPRERFDAVNKTAKEAKKLIELGILTEDEDGELHINKEVLKPQEESKKEEKGEVLDFDKLEFTKDEVADDSWPLVEKINKRFKAAKGVMQEYGYYIRVLLAENRIMKDYPEFIQRDSALRKKANEIMKSDKEFQSTYKGQPEAGYWAVKRAYDALNPSSKKSSEGKPKPKSKFIVGRGDGSGKPSKKIGLMDLGSMTKEQLDDLERKEHDRLSKLKK